MTDIPTPEEMANAAGIYDQAQHSQFKCGVRAERARVFAAVPEELAIDHRSSVADVYARGYNACRALWLKACGEEQDHDDA